VPAGDGARMCRAGLHRIPRGRDRCWACKGARDRARRAAASFPATDRLCPAGLHTIPAGAGRCAECKRSGDRERTKLAGALRGKHLPVVEILDGAACPPELACGFDVGAPRHEKPAENRRHRAAQDICAGCPVRRACYVDALTGRQLGVYGGVVMDQGFWSLHGRGLVQDVPVVPDSPAC